MSLYESVFIARQDISTAQVESLTETFEKIITDQGGSVPKKESWGLRTLAYRIKKKRKGYYVLMNIDAPAPAIHEMERQMRINEDIIRFLTTRVEELEEGPSAVLRAKERGDDRGRRGGRDDRPFRKSRDSRDAGDGDKKAPEKADAKTPEKKAEAKTPEKEAEAKTPEKKADAKTPEKKADAKTPEKKADAKTPEKDAGKKEGGDK